MAYTLIKREPQSREAYDTSSTKFTTEVTFELSLEGGRGRTRGKAVPGRRSDASPKVGGKVASDKLQCGKSCDFEPVGG